VLEFDIESYFDAIKLRELMRPPAPHGLSEVRALRAEAVYGVPGSVIDETSSAHP